jgi:hypothetical protein
MSSLTIVCRILRPKIKTLRKNSCYTGQGLGAEKTWIEVPFFRAFSVKSVEEQDIGRKSPYLGQMRCKLLFTDAQYLSNSFTVFVIP